MYENFLVGCYRPQSVCSRVRKYCVIPLSPSPSLSLSLTICSVLGVDGLSHPPPALPTDNNFDSLFEQFTSFIFGSEENGGQVSTAELQALSGYQVSNYNCLPVSVCLKPMNHQEITMFISADGLCVQYGDVMVTAGETGQRGVFWLPAPGVTADCVDKSPAGIYH